MLSRLEMALELASQSGLANLPVIHHPQLVRSRPRLLAAECFLDSRS